MVIRGNTGGKCYRLLPEKENTVFAFSFMVSSSQKWIIKTVEKKDLGKIKQRVFSHYIALTWKMGVVNPDAISCQINSFPFYLFFLLKIKLTLVRGKEAMANHRWCQNLVSECVANILTTLKGLLWFFYCTDPQQWRIYMFYIVKSNILILRWH